VLVVGDGHRLGEGDSFALALQELAWCGSFWSAAEEGNGSAAFPFRGAFQDGISQYDDNLLGFSDFL
jgi:hypothetical protein